MNLTDYNEKLRRKIIHVHNVSSLILNTMTTRIRIFRGSQQKPRLSTVTETKVPKRYIYIFLGLGPVDCKFLSSDCCRTRVKIYRKAKIVCFSFGYAKEQFEISPFKNNI